MSLKITQPPFWFVWNPHGRAPTYRHQSLESATTEATRLAKENPGRTFIVLESVCAKRVDEILDIDMRPFQDIPF